MHTWKLLLIQDIWLHTDVTPPPPHFHTVASAKKPHSDSGKMEAQHQPFAAGLSCLVFLTRLLIIFSSHFKYHKSTLTLYEAFPSLVQDYRFGCREGCQKTLNPKTYGQDAVTSSGSGRRIHRPSPACNLPCQVQ
jgi:hypothetical protein